MDGVCQAWSGAKAERSAIASRHVPAGRAGMRIAVDAGNLSTPPSLALFLTLPLFLCVPSFSLYFWSLQRVQQCAQDP